MKLDPWQEKVLNTEGNICLRSGRQVGKSTVISHKAGAYAINNPKKTILVIAAVERQAFLLFDKTLAYLTDNHKNQILRGKNRPTKSRIKLKNGSIIYCLPTGLSGYGIRGYTIDLLIADEAAFIPEEVWTAVTPMLAVTRGDIILLSTPFGKDNFFFRCFNDPNFTSFHVSSEDCPRKNQAFLDQEKKRMTTLQYAQEYLGEFVDELLRFFSDDTINNTLLPQYAPIKMKSSFENHFLGVDVAGMGGDETVLFSIGERKDKLEETDLEVYKRTRTTETVQKILHKDRQFNYRNIYIDDGGLGVGVFDPLLEHQQTRRKVISINNAARSLTRDKKRRKKLLKEDLYNNLLVLMEQGQIKIRDTPETILSLKSVQCEHTESGIRIYGKYTHITEALIRAAWCLREKSLNIYIY